jgi:uncharacterized RDD family membrane protein YckC
MKIFGLAWDFVLHILFGSLIFGCVAAGAVGLHFATEWAAAGGLPSLIVLGLRVLEYFVFAADFICYALFVIAVAWKFIIQLWEEFRKG